jgi:hypothetical protein
MTSHSGARNTVVAPSITASGPASAIPAARRTTLREPSAPTT